MHGYKHKYLDIEKLGEILEFANSSVYDRSHGTMENRAYSWIVGKNNLGAVIARLKEDGYPKAMFSGCGDNVVMVETSPGKLLRLRGGISDNPSSWDAPDIDQMISVFYKAEVNGCRILGVNKIKTLDNALNEGLISKKDADLLTLHLRLAVTKQFPPCYFYDYKKYNGEIKYEQIGLLPDFTPVIINMGSVVKKQDYLDYAQKVVDERAHRRIMDELNELERMPPPALSTAIPWDGKWLTPNGQRKVDILSEGTNKRKSIER